MRHVTLKSLILLVSMVVAAILFTQELYLHSVRENRIVVAVTSSDLKGQVVANLSSPSFLFISSNKTIPQKLKHVKDTGLNIFIFSAVIGNTSRNATFDRVVLSVWVDRKYSNNSNFKCCLWYQSRRLVTTKLKSKINWAYMKQTKIQAKQYVCPNPRGAQGDILARTTIVFNQSKCPLSTVWYVKPTYAFRHDNEIAVCSKVAYGSLPADDIISWFEIHRYMGVQKVLTYTDSLNPAAQRVLDYYASIGLAEVYPFVVPKYGRGRQAVARIGVKNFQAWNDEQVPVYDCLEKLRGYKYLAVVDFDEYIIPEDRGTWKSLFEKLWGQRPWAAGFQLLVQLHITSWGTTNSSGHFITQKYVNRTKPMVDRSKNIVMPERLAVGGLSTHGFWPDHRMHYKKLRCPSAVATIHHYRSCRKEWNGRKNRTNCHDLQRFTDTIVADAMSKVEKRALEIRRNLFPAEVTN